MTSGLLVVVHESGHGITPTAELDVATVHVDAASGDALARLVRDRGTPRWLLVGEGTGVGLVGAFAADVLSGRAAVFGLAGVVVLGPAPAGAVPDVPTLVVDGGDATARVQEFWASYAGRGPTVPADFAAMIASDRVSRRTRGIHARRALADDPEHPPTALDAAQLATLRVLAGLVVPQGDPATSIDLAVRVETQLAAGQGDGWRHADLPVDVEAYRAGLDALSGLADLTAGEQHAALTRLAAGEWGGSALSGAQLALWFEDARNDLVRQWLAHPATMARIGYDGLANGGDGDAFRGFVTLGAGERESWEPAMVGTR